MKIIIVNDYGYEYGGAEISLIGLKNVLIANGNNVDNFYGNNFKLSFISRFFSIYYLFKFYRFLAGKKIDIIHYNKINLSLSASLFLVGKVFGIKQIITIHDYGIICPDGWMIDNNNCPCTQGISYSCLLKRCGRAKNTKFYFRSKFYTFLNYFKNTLHLFLISHLADRIIFPSRNLMLYGTKIFNVNKCLYIPNQVSISVNQFKNIPNDGFNKILFIGRLSGEKGIEVAINAVNYIIKNNLCVSINFTIIGDGKDKFKILNLISNLGLSNYIHLLGKVDNDKIGDYYYNSGIILMPSIWLENNPLVALEAMKAGRPILASNAGGFPDLVEDGKNGYLFKMGNHIDLAQKIVALLGDKEKLIKMGKYGFEKVKKEFNSDLFYKRIMDAYTN